MGQPLATILAGLFGTLGGLASGMFGIGGAVITTPLIRIFLGVSAISAVATPLVGVIPSAIVGASQYVRARLVDWRVGLVAGAAGALMSALGAALVEKVGGTVALLVTAIVILWAAIDTVESIVRDRRQASRGGDEPASDSADIDRQASTASPASPASTDTPTAPSSAPLTSRRALIAVATGAIAGIYSGFLGLGGGFVVVPLFRRALGLTQRQAVGTSLVAVAILAVPGTIAHALLGNIDWWIALGLAVGVVPGATLGAKLMVGSSERTAKVAFAVLMVGLGLWLAIGEFAHLG